MAENPKFSSRPTDGKRKYESTRQTTGFSSPITSSSPNSHTTAPPPPLYNSASPPVEEIQIAKQRAQDIAARILSGTEAKSRRIENGGTGIDDSSDMDLTQKPAGQQFGNSQVGIRISTPPLVPVAYGFQGSSKKIDIPNGRVGVIIGKSGETIHYLQLQSGAKIQVTKDMDSDPTSLTRMVELIGTHGQVSKAEQLINDVLAEAEAGSSGIVAARRFTAGQVRVEPFVMKVPNNKVGLIIGKGAEKIKNMQARSGARIQLIPLHLPLGDASTERTVQIDGTKEQIESAKQLVNEVVSGNHVRNPPMAGGYLQQGYCTTGPLQFPKGCPPHPPKVMQQPGYGCMQPGEWLPAPPQSNLSQLPYTSYLPQPTSAGYSSGWEQTPVPPNQQTAPGSGYDYCSQQPQQQQQPAPGGSSKPADNTSYNYSQPPTSYYNPQWSYGEFNYLQPPVGQQQGNRQDGYGAGYHAPAPQLGFTQPQSNPQPGYDQQQCYNSAPAYGSMVNPSQDETTPSYGAQVGPTQVPPAQQVSPPVQSPATQVYTGRQPTNSIRYPSQGSSSTSHPGYGSQPLTQPGYGQFQGQKPPPTQAVYGQAQLPPTTQAGYVQPAPVEAGYSHSQPPSAQSGYIQQDSSHLWTPPAGYGSGAPQLGYGQPQSYGAPPLVAQPGYWQQQSQQPYGSGSYGGGYSQPPPVYSTDNAMAPGAQPVVPSGVAKASPQS